jgi:hypothetical protein
LLRLKRWLSTTETDSSSFPSTRLVSFIMRVPFNG